MSSRPRTLVLLIGAARAVPHPISSNPTQITSELNLRIPAANGEAAAYLRLVNLPPSSTVDAASMVTPVDVSTSTDLASIVIPIDVSKSTDLASMVTPVDVLTSADLTDIVTPIDLSSFSTTRCELTGVTQAPVRESTPSSRTVVTISSVPPTSIAEAQITPNTITITDWVTVTLPGPPPNDSGSVTVPVTVGPLHCSNMASGRPELPGGILGGPAPNNFEKDEA